jgi:hypothetical protein
LGVNGKNLLIGTPAYSGRLHTDYVKSLLETHAYCNTVGIKVQATFLCQCARITRARHEIVRLFMGSDFDNLLMIDSDIGWEPHAPAQLLEHELPYVGAVTVKRGTEQMCMRNLDTHSQNYDYDPDRRLLRVGAVGTAFVMFSRQFFEQMERAYPNLLLSEETGGHPAYGFFAEMITPEGNFEGEDYSLSNRWRAIGGDILVDPWITLSHVSEKTFRGSLADEMKLHVQVSAATAKAAQSDPVSEAAD